ncbi:MAG: ABC transporter permease [Oscillospiraceae bacterium]|nr:ABC transporter permease [Oscillospiraceae bacterium]
MKGSFKALLYRDIFLGRKQLKSATTMFFVATALVVLILLSFRHGNLALLDKEIVEGAKIMIMPVVKFMPVLVACFLPNFVSEAVAREESGLWSKFRRSTPVSHWCFALADYTLIFVFILLAFLVSAGYVAIICKIEGDAFDKRTIAIIVALALCSLAFCILMQIMTMLFKSVEIAGLAFTGAMMLAMFLYVFLAPETDMTNDEIFAKLGGFCEDILPFSPVIFISILLAGFCAAAMLYKRREK